MWAKRETDRWARNFTVVRLRTPSLESIQPGARWQIRQIPPSRQECSARNDAVKVMTMQQHFLVTHMFNHLSIYLPYPTTSEDSVKISSEWTYGMTLKGISLENNSGHSGLSEDYPWAMKKADVCAYWIIEQGRD